MERFGMAASERRQDKKQASRQVAWWDEDEVGSFAMVPAALGPRQGRRPDHDLLATGPKLRHPPLLCSSRASIAPCSPSRRRVRSMSLSVEHLRLAYWLTVTRQDDAYRSRCQRRLHPLTDFNTAVQESTAFNAEVDDDAIPPRLPGSLPPLP